MNTYFRITAYHPTLNISFIIDSINLYDEIWKFSAALVRKKCKILEVSDSQQFQDGNIPPAQSPNDCYVLRACVHGKAEKGDGVINVNGRYYTPNTGT
jgi:hypothetical protein